MAFTIEGKEMYPIFVWFFKKFIVNCTSVLLIFYILLSRFFKGKSKEWVLLFFLSVFFQKKTGGFFWDVFLQQPWNLQMSQMWFWCFSFQFEQSLIEDLMSVGKWQLQ